MTKVICPIDFSECSEQALALGVDLAGTLGGPSAEVVLLHAYELPWHLTPTGIATEAANPGGVMDIMKSLTTQLRGQLDEIKKRFEDRGVSIHTQLAEGPPYQVICDIAGDRKADLIIMGTHGRTGLPRWSLGSVAERVVRMAPCPVVTVRQNEAA